MALAELAAEVCPVCLHGYPRIFSDDAVVVCANRHVLHRSCMQKLRIYSGGDAKCPECRFPLLPATPAMESYAMPPKIPLASHGKLFVAVDTYPLRDGSLRIWNWGFTTVDTINRISRLFNYPIRSASAESTFIHRERPVIETIRVNRFGRVNGAQVQYGSEPPEQLTVRYLAERFAKVWVDLITLYNSTHPGNELNFDATLEVELAYEECSFAPGDPMGLTVSFQMTRLYQTRVPGSKEPDQRLLYRRDWFLQHHLNTVFHQSMQNAIHFRMPNFPVPEQGQSLLELVLERAGLVIPAIHASFYNRLAHKRYEIPKPDGSLYRPVVERRWRLSVIQSNFEELEEAAEAAANAEAAATSSWGSSSRAAGSVRCVSAMTWPPNDLRPDWDYERYNDAMIEELEKHKWWNEYVALRETAHKNKTPLSPEDYPEDKVLGVQLELNEVAMAARLEALQLASMRVAETGGPLGKRRAPPPAKDGDPVDPDVLIAAFKKAFEDAWKEVSTTLEAVRTNTGLEARYLAWQKMVTDAEGEETEAAAEAIHAGLQSEAMDIVRYQLKGAAVSEKKLVEEATAAQTAMDEYKAMLSADDMQRRIARCQAVVDTINTGKYDNGVQTHMSIANLDVRVALMRDKVKAKDAEYTSMTKNFELVKKQVQAMKEFRMDQKNGTWRKEEEAWPPKRALGAGTNYSKLWRHPDYSHLELVRLPPGQTIASYAKFLEMLKEALDRQKAECQAEEERLQKQKTRLTKATGFLETLQSEEKKLAAKLNATKKNALGFSNLGRYLLNAFPLDSERAGGTVTQLEKRGRWAALMRVFHEPQPGFARGRSGAGEPAAFLVQSNKRDFSFFGEVAEAVFDVVALPHESNLKAVRIVGARWCSDLAFVRQLIHLSVDVANLPPGSITVEARDDVSQRKTLVVSVRDPLAPRPRQRDDELDDDFLQRQIEANEAHQAEVALRAPLRRRVQAFGAVVEVAARKVRATLGKRNVATKPPTEFDDVALGFDEFTDGTREPNLIGWDLHLNRVHTTSMNDQSLKEYTLGMRDALFAMLARMGAEPDARGEGGGLGSQWARETAAVLADGGSSRQLAIAVQAMDAKKTSLRYGLAGSSLENEFYEFGVVTSSPESERALGELLRFEDIANPVFGHLHPVVVHLTGPTTDVASLAAFLVGPRFVALAFYFGRYHVLFKDNRKSEEKATNDVVLIDTWGTTKKSPINAFKKAVEAANRITGGGGEGGGGGGEGGGAWKGVEQDQKFAYRDAGQEGQGDFLVGMSRALLLSLGVHRTIEGRDPYYPLLGPPDYETFQERHKEGASYKVRHDQASAVSSIKWGFGPLCIALAALSHNESSVEAVGVETRRVELWD